MRIDVSICGAYLYREPGDRPMRRESEVATAARDLLNAFAGRARWRRFDPSRTGMTSCRFGVWDGKTVYWHERCQVEDAAKAFNAGVVFLRKFDL